MSAIVGLPFELPFWPGGTGPNISSHALDAANDALEMIFQAKEDLVLTRLGFRQTIANTPCPTYKISLQSVADGIPTGVILGGASPASTTFTPTSAGDGTWQWKNLDNAIAITRGTWYALVIARDSGTIDGSHFCSFSLQSFTTLTVGEPYAIANDAGVRTRASGGAIFGYGSAGTAYGQPLSAVIATGFNSGSTPDEKASLITIPTTWWDTYKILGAALYGTLAAATSFDLVLYDSDGTTVLQTITIDTDNDQASVSGRRRVILFDESTLATLNSGSGYRLAFKPAGTNLTLAGLTVAAAGDMDAYAGGAAICQASTQTNAGGWTNDSLSRFGINPIVADIAAATAPVGCNLSVADQADGTGATATIAGTDSGADNEIRVYRLAGGNQPGELVDTFTRSGDGTVDLVLEVGTYLGMLASDSYDCAPPVRFTVTDAAADYMITLAERALRLTLANCDTFQNLCGVGDETAAAGRIHVNALPWSQDGESFQDGEQKAYRPFALVFTWPHEGFHYARVAEKTFVDSGRLGLVIEQNVPADVARDDNALLRRFENTISLLMVELKELERTSPDAQHQYLAIDDVILGAVFRCDDDDVATRGDYIAAELIIVWGV